MCRSELATDTNCFFTEVVISPPAIYLLLAREHLRQEIEVAAQNVFDRPNGAYTGEISVSQLQDSGITWAILGHSERRTILQEDNAVSLFDGER
jgi:triosephosphate isomerase (TIM)